MLPIKYFIPMIVAGAGGFHTASCLYHSSYVPPKLNLSNLEVVNKDGNLSDTGWWIVKEKGK